MQGSTVKTFKSTDLLAVGFTGVNQFSKKISDLFEGTSIQESFLYITVIESMIHACICILHYITVMYTTILAGFSTVLAENTFFPYNFSLIDLPQAKITISDETMATNSTIKVCIINSLNC